MTLRVWLGVGMSGILWMGALGCTPSPKDAGPPKDSGPPRDFGSPKQSPPLAVAVPSAPALARGESASPPASAPTALPPELHPTAAPDYRFPAAKRVVAIGDLHGDFHATETVFQLAGATDPSGHWVGGDLVVVQAGDQLDRGDDEREIIEFLVRLKAEAKAKGGMLIVLNGNHETMNVMGDFRYVTPGALHAFDGYLPASPVAYPEASPYRSRAAAFLPGGGAALLLAEHPLIVVVGDTVYVHAGILPQHVDYGIDRLNTETRAWMRGERPAPPHPLIEEEGPVWTRIYGTAEVSAQACELLAATLKRLGVRRMVVGHTVQQWGLSSACNETVFRVDVGLSRHYGVHPAQALEIVGDQTKILTAAP